MEKLVLVARGCVVAVFCGYGQFAPITIRERLSCHRSYQINLSQLQLPLQLRIRAEQRRSCQNPESITTNSYHILQRPSTAHDIPFRRLAGRAPGGCGDDLAQGP